MHPLSVSHNNDLRHHLSHQALNFFMQETQVFHLCCLRAEFIVDTQ